MFVCYVPQFICYLLNEIEQSIQSVCLLLSYIFGTGTIWTTLYSYILVCIVYYFIGWLLLVTCSLFFYSIIHITYVPSFYHPDLLYLWGAAAGSDSMVCHPPPPTGCATCSQSSLFDCCVMVCWLVCLLPLLCDVCKEPPIIYLLQFR